MDNVSQLYGLAVLLGGLGLLTALVVRGQSIFVAAPLSAMLILAASGMDPIAGMSGPFMTGFADYIRKFFFIFALGAAFGKLMDESGAAARIAAAIVRLLGTRWACLAVVLAAAVLTYGGVSLFVVGFSVYPLAVRLFREADLPRRFIPGSLAFGSITFTMTSAGSPEIQNLIPISYLIDARTGEALTDALAGWPVSLIVALVMFTLGQWYLETAIRRDIARGGHFEPRPTDPVDDETADGRKRPGLFVSLLPLLVTLVMLNVLPRIGEALEQGWLVAIEGQARQWLQATLLKFRDEPALAIFAGVLAGVCGLWPYLVSPSRAVGEGFVNGFLAIGSTSAVVGFGTALKDLPAFHQLVDWVTHMPGDPLIGAAIGVAIVCGISGSASGGQGIAWPIIKPIFVDELGVMPRALHRVVAIASGSLDSLPANGYVVMLVRNICGETHAQAYGPIFVLTVAIPLLGTTLAIALFKLMPAWGAM
jgi:H+/gluconate symporter-like permease